MTWLVVFGLTMAFVWFARALTPALRGRRVRMEEAEAHVRAMPNALVLLQIATLAGRTPREAIETLADLSASGGIELVVDDFATVAERLRLGAGLSDAVLAHDGGPSAASMLRVLDLLRRAEDDGGALGVQLALLLLDFRRTRALALDAAAQRMTVSLLFPLVLCILPAFILLAIAPLLLVSFAELPG